MEGILAIDAGERGDLILLGVTVLQVWPLSSEKEKYCTQEDVRINIKIVPFFNCITPGSCVTIALGLGTSLLDFQLLPLSSEK